jgi:uncharacterized protein
MTIEPTRTSRRWPLVALSLSPLVLAPAVQNWGVITAFVIALLALAAIPAARRPTLAFLSGTWRRSVVIGLVAGLVVGGSSLIYEPLLGELLGDPIDLSAFAGVRGNLQAYLGLLAVGIVVGGIFEEFLFRGFVIGWGSALLGERAAPWLALGSAVAFGMAHAYQGPTGMIATGLVGAMLGAVYILAGRKLLPAMLCHAFINVIGVTALYLGWT